MPKKVFLVSGENPVYGELKVNQTYLDDLAVEEYETLEHAWQAAKEYCNEPGKDYKMCVVVLVDERGIWDLAKIMIHLNAQTVAQIPLIAKLVNNVIREVKAEIVYKDHS